MSKTRDTGYLANVIQVHDTGVRIMSGSTMLMAISSSGAVTITGEMSGSDAANALLLDGTGSLGFAATDSFLAVSSSQQQISASLLNVVATSATTGSNTFTGAQYVSDTSNGIGFTSTASFYTDGGLRVGKNAYVSGTAYFNNIVVFGTSSIQYITSSQVNIGANIITVNTDTPAVRFGGLSVFDSGSTQLTGSMLWDSEKNHWVYSNPSGSSYSGGMFISGPRSSALGSEQGTTACMLLVGQGSDHLTSSMIYHSSICTNFYSNALFVSSSGNVGIGTVNPIAPLTIKSSGATGVFLACDTANAAASSRLFFESCHNQFSVFNSSGKLQFNYAASSPSTSGVLGIVMDSSGNLLVGTGTAAGTEKLGVTRDDGVGNGLHVIADFNRSLGSSAELILGYLANGSTVTGPVVYSSNGFPLLFSVGAAERMRINSGGCVGIGATSPCSLLNVHCVSGGGDSLYTNTFTITTDASSVYNHLAFSPTSIEYRREASTGVDLCIMTKITTGGSGGNIVFAPNLENTSYCSFPRMKIQQNGFIGIGAVCAQTYIHVCDNLSTGRDDLIRLQTNVSTNHAWLKSISCAGVTSIFGSNRANTDGALIANHAVAGTTSGHNFDLISNSTVRVRISSGGAVCLLGNSNDYPSLFLAGPTYTMVAMGDRTSSAGTDAGYLSIYNQGARTIDLPGNADPITFNNGGPMIAGRAYASGDPTYGYQFLEICNGNMFHGPLTMGNSGGGLALTPLYCGGGKRYGLGWNSGELNNIANYNNCTPIVIHWGINGDNPTNDRKFCFNYNGQAYATSGTWGTLSSNCVIKDHITAASSQWNDIKNICIVNYKMKEEIEEFGDCARMHLGVVAEQVAQVSPGLLENGGYSEKWCACLNGVKTSILHMKAVKALQEAMCRIELLESCLGIA